MGPIFSVISPSLPNRHLRTLRRKGKEGGKASFLPCFLPPSSALHLSLSASRCSLGSAREREREGDRPGDGRAGRPVGLPCGHKQGEQRGLPDMGASPGHNNPKNAFLFSKKIVFCVPSLGKKLKDLPELLGHGLVQVARGGSLR